jgi:cystathionine beta-lyase/cystathionine gamma-synthase
MAQMDIESSFIGMSTDPSSIIKHLKSTTRLVWIETPTNPLLKLADIEQLSNIVHDYNPKIMVLGDNTFSTSFYQRPLELGADIVLHGIRTVARGHLLAIGPYVTILASNCPKPISYVYC